MGGLFSAGLEGFSFSSFSAEESVEPLAESLFIGSSFSGSDMF